LRKLACVTPVDQLVKKGIKEVNVVGFDHIVALIEEAVHRSLRHKLIGIDRLAVAGAAREEFLRLIRSHRNLERSHDEALRLKRRAEEEIDELRRQITEQDHRLREKLSEAEQGQRARREGENVEIVQKVNDIFAALTAGTDTDVPGLRQGVLELVMDIVDRERDVATQARQAAHDREIELLERRIAKLKTNLQATVLRFSRGQPIDDGISSIYREVQGLDSDDSLYERKRELMKTIFQANLTLQKNLFLKQRAV
jgi:hypothetical protein